MSNEAMESTLEIREPQPEAELSVNECLFSAIQWRAGLRLVAAPRAGEGRQSKAQLAQAFNLPSNRRWRLRWAPSRRQLEIGPLIGVLVSTCRHGRSPMGSSTAPCQMMGRMWERRSGALVFFQLKDISLETRKVYGCCWLQGRWRWSTYPLPAVIYNRISHRTVENSEEYMEFRAGFARRGGLLFNPHYLDKWSAYRMLNTSPQVSMALPASVLLENREQLQRYLRLYTRVFLKPIGGSQGRGIVMMQLSSPGIIMKYAQSGVVKRLSDVGKVSDSFFTGKYLLQQGLHLMTRHNEPIDLRLLMQKNERGRWRRTKAFARVGTRSSIVSNISQGGMASGINAALAQAFYASPQARKKVLRQITKVAVAVCAAFDKVPGEHWAELGIDIGVDQRGKVWLIEVNARPWKRAYVITGSKVQMLKALLRPLEHAAYLTGFTRKEEQNNHDLAANEAHL